MGLIASLEKDQKEAGLDGEGKPVTEGKEDGQSTDGGADARSRVSTRRNARKSGTPSPDEDGSPSGDGGASRGSQRDTPGSGKDAQKDGSAPQVDDGAPQSGEPDGVLDEPKTPSEWVKHRKEKREAQAEIKRLKDELVAARTAPVQKQETITPPATQETPDYKSWLKTNPAPDKEKDLAGWLVWNAEANEAFRNDSQTQNEKQTKEREMTDLRSRAIAETEEIQNNYKKENPDYENAYNHMKQEYINSVNKLMPGRFNEAAMNDLIKQEILNMGIACAKQGTNLGEVLYDMAIERFGYNKSDLPAPNPSLRTSRAPNLKVIANNQKKGASPLEGGGKSGSSRITVERAAQMTPQELQQLSADDWKFLETAGFA